MPCGLSEDLWDDPMFDPICTYSEPPACDGARESMEVDRPSAAMDSLPDCVILSILDHLDAQSLCVLATLAHSWASLASEPLLWQQLLWHRYGPLEAALPQGALHPPAGGSWREHYFALGMRGERHWGRLAVQGHSSRASCWLYINGTVYDVTDFMDTHPGMDASLLLFGGTDASEAFNEVSHSRQAIRFMATLAVDGLSLPPEGFPAGLLPPSECRRIWDERGRAAAAGGASAAAMLRGFVSRQSSQASRLLAPYVEATAELMPAVPSPESLPALAWRTGFNATDRLQRLIEERWRMTTTADFDPDEAQSYWSG